MNKFVETAITAVQAAEEIIKYYYQRPINIEVKSDATPVTIADREAELAIKAVLQGAFPEHGFWGEETGQQNADKDYLWLIDPIDGTKSFVREQPFFSTQLALWHQGQVIVGVSNAPIFAELAYANLGAGAYLNHKALQVSKINQFASAVLSFGNIKTLVREQPAQFIGLIEQCNRIRGYGDFYHSHLLAAGKLDMVVETDVSILDIAALSLIVIEAGGRVSDINGQAIDLNTTTYLASNGLLHQRLLEQLANNY